MSSVRSILLEWVEDSHPEGQSFRVNARSKSDSMRLAGPNSRYRHPARKRIASSTPPRIRPPSGLLPSLMKPHFEDLLACDGQRTCFRTADGAPLCVSQHDHRKSQPEGRVRMESAIIWTYKPATTIRIPRRRPDPIWTLGGWSPGLENVWRCAGGARGHDSAGLLGDEGHSFNS